MASKSELTGWHERWEVGRTNWRIEEEDKRPVKNWASIEEVFGSSALPESGARVLVPLCGDSSILQVVIDAGHSVTGVEFSEIAVERAKALFPDREFTVEKQDTGLVVHASTDGRMTMVQGDFFAFAADAEFDVVYDRASLVAIQPENREKYAAIVAAATKPGGCMFLDAFAARDEGKENGPPFMIPQELVAQLYYANGAFEEVKVLENVKQNPKLGQTNHWFMQRKS